MKLASEKTQTPRSLALEHGAGEGIEERMPYCPGCGCPTAMCGGHYKDNAEAAQATPTPKPPPSVFKK